MQTGGKVGPLCFLSWDFLLGFLSALSEDARDAPEAVQCALQDGAGQVFPLWNNTEPYVNKEA